jgi:hypothetical protein
MPTNGMAQPSGPQGFGPTHSRPVTAPGQPAQLDLAQMAVALPTATVMPRSQWSSDSMSGGYSTAGTRAPASRSVGAFGWLLLVAVLAGAGGVAYMLVRERAPAVAPAATPPGPIASAVAVDQDPSTPSSDKRIQDQDRPTRTDRSDRSDRGDRGDRTDRGDRGDRTDRKSKTPKELAAAADKLWDQAVGGNRGKWKDVVDAYEAIIKLGDDSPVSSSEAYFRLARAHAKTSDFDDAQKALSKVGVSHMREEQLELRGDIAVGQKRWEDARAQYRKLIDYPDGKIRKASSEGAVLRERIKEKYKHINNKTGKEPTYGLPDWLVRFEERR